MPTYTNNVRVTQPDTGSLDGTWGTTANTIFELFDTSFGYEDFAMPDSNDSITISDGSTSEGRGIVVNVTGALTADRTLTFLPNTSKKLWIVKNSTTGGFNILAAQGSGSTVTVAPGMSALVYGEGAGSTADMINALASIALTTLTATTGTITTLGSTTGTITTANVTTGNITTVNATTVKTGATPATAGAIRMSNAETIQVRDNGNSADLEVLTVNASDQLVIGNDTSLDSIRLGASGVPATVLDKVTVDMGTTSGFAPAFSKNIETLYDHSTTGYALGILGVVNQTALNGSGGPQGIEGYAITTHGTGNVILSIGTVGNAEHNGAGTLSEMRGGSFTVGIGDSGAGNVTTAKGIHIANAFDTGAGAITTQYGLWIEGQTNGATNYAIYTNDGLVRFGGNTTVVGTMAATTFSGSGASLTNIPVTAFDLSTLPDMTTPVVKLEDELVLLDNGTQKRKLFNEINLSDFNDDLSYGTGTVTSVGIADGTGFTVSGSPVESSGNITLALRLDEFSEKSGTVAFPDRLIGVSGTTQFAETIDQIPLSSFLDDLSYGTGTVTQVQVTATGASNPIALTGDTTITASGTVNIDLTLSSLPTMAGTAMIASDQFIVLDSTVQKRKPIGEIPLSLFNDDLSYGTGTVTSVGIADGTGFTVSGSPVTASGNITVTLRLDEFSEKSGAVAGTDRLVGVSGTTQFAETISGIPLTAFDDSSVGFTTHTESTLTFFGGGTPAGRYSNITVPTLSGTYSSDFANIETAIGQIVSCLESYNLSTP